MRLFVLAQVIFALVGSVAQAQYIGASAGIGLWGGQPTCEVRIPEEIRSIEDDIKDLEKEKRELDREKRELVREKRETDRKVRDAERDVKRVLKDEANDINVHNAVVTLLKNPGAAKATIQSACERPEGQRQAEPWSGFCGSGCGQAAQSDDPDAALSTAASSSSCVGDEAKYWSEAWDPHDVTNAGNICRNTVTMGANSKMIKPEYNASTGANETARNKCSDGIKVLREGYPKQAGYGAQVAAIDQRIKDIKEEIKYKKKDKREELEDYRERLADGEDVEADYCYSCTHGNQVKLSTADRIGGVLSTALIGAATYYGTKYTVDQNQKLGWPTSPWMAIKKGYPIP